MFKYLKRSWVFMIILCALIMCSLSGCGKIFGRDPDSKHVIAKINDYELSVRDFKDEASFSMKLRFLASNPLEAKEDFLEEMITQNILIQEAQKQNFDKDGAFMKEIERYWRQTLLKLLVKKKTEELSEFIKISRAEIEEEYENLQRRIKAQIVILDEYDLAMKLSGALDNFDNVKMRVDQNIVSAKKAEWWQFGDLPDEIGDKMFMLKPGEISEPVKYGELWAVVRVIEEEPLNIGSYEKKANSIRKRILNREKRKGFG